MHARERVAPFTALAQQHVSQCLQLSMCAAPAAPSRFGPCGASALVALRCAMTFPPPAVCHLLYLPHAYAQRHAVACILGAHSLILSRRRCVIRPAVCMCCMSRHSPHKLDEGTKHGAAEFELHHIAVAWFQLSQAS